MLVSSVKEFPHLDSFVDNYANDWREAKFSLTFYLRVDYTVMFCFTNFNEFFKSFKDVVRRLSNIDDRPFSENV